MANTIKLKRRVGGSQAAPGGGSEGEVAVYFPGTAGASTKPVIYLHDGVGYRIANPDVTITTQSITLGTAADIGAAYTAWATTPANTITGSVVIATFGTPAQAYVLTNSAAPGVAASWTSLGGAVSFANATEIHAGTDTTKAINSAGLRGETKDTSTPRNAVAEAGYIPRLNTQGLLDPGFIPAAGVGTEAQVIAGLAVNMFLTPASLEMRVAHTPNATPATDVNKLPALDATGKIPAAFLPAGGLHFVGNKDLTVPYVAPAAGAAPKNGDLAFVGKDGTVDASWNAVLVDPPAKVGVGDMLVFEGGTVNKWHITASDVDVSGFVSKAGVSTMAADGRINFSAAAPAAGAAPSVILDGGAGGGSVDNLYINCGTY